MSQHEHFYTEKKKKYGGWEKKTFFLVQHTVFDCYAIALQLGQNQGAYKNVSLYVWLPPPFPPLQSKILLGGPAIKKEELKKKSVLGLGYIIYHNICNIIGLFDI